jgi:poly(beta-D-mannuronate) lyase
MGGDLLQGWRGRARPLGVAMALLMLVASPAMAQTLAVSNPISPGRAATDPAIAGERRQPCPRPPAAVVDHADVVFYTDAANSVVSEELWRRRMALNRPIRDFTAVVMRNADAYLTSGSQLDWRAACAASWLDAWAAGRALLGDVTTWARYDTLWFGQVPLSVAYLKIRHSNTVSPQVQQRVGAWLSDVAKAAIAEQDTPLFRDRLTNIRAWTAASAAVAAVATNDRALLDYAVKNARAILETVTAEGALPNELARGRRAFSYHVWALEPLALVALVAEANGARLTGVNNRALERLTRFVIAAARDPDLIAGLAKTEQDQSILQWPRSWELGAFEIMQSLAPTPEAEAILARFRPVQSPFTGGDWTLTLGRRPASP